MEKTVQIWAGLATVATAFLAYLQFATTETPLTASELAKEVSRLPPAEIVVAFSDITASASELAQDRDDAKAISDAANSLTSALSRNFGNATSDQDSFVTQVSDGVFTLEEGEGKLLNPRKDLTGIPFVFRERNREGSLEGSLETYLEGESDRMRLGDSREIRDANRHQTNCFVTFFGQSLPDETSTRFKAKFYLYCRE